jgi:hypothetical protein
MAVVIRCLGIAAVQSGALVNARLQAHSDFLVGKYLASYDLDAHDGRGTDEWVSDPTQALHFESNAAALKVWRTPSLIRPLRPDGQPNRPLTAYTVEVSELEDT